MMELAQLIEKHGITIVVLLWFMVRSERRMDRQAELQTQTLVSIAALAKAIDAITMALTRELNPRREIEDEEAPPPPRRRAPTRRPENND